MKVLVVDDQTLVRQGICRLFEVADEYFEVREAADGKQAVELLLAGQSFDVVLLDMQMPEMDGIEVLRVMRDHQIQVPVIILTTFNDPEKMVQCNRLGAKGYLLKDVDLDQLVLAIKEVVAGGTLIQPAVTQRTLEGLRKRDSETYRAEHVEELSHREHEILRYMAGGYSNKEIANAISLSEGTVKNHVSVVLSKLGVRDRTRAVMKALDLGLLG